MRFGFLALAAMTALASCGAGETVTQYGGSAYSWTLTELDGVAVDYTATLELSDGGAVDGEGPCNGFSGTQSKPYPWIEIQIDFVEEVYCSGIDDEEAYLAALSEMTLVEVSGPTLVMSNDAGREMVFTGLASGNDA